jgi:hypothetical protein
LIGSSPARNAYNSPWKATRAYLELLFDEGVVVEVKVLQAALGDAAWLTGLERNADVVTMEAYAPSMANVNPGAFTWPTTLTTCGGSLLYESVTRASQNGTVYLKLVNMAGEVQLLHVTFNGADCGQRKATAVMLTSHTLAARGERRAE